MWTVTASDLTANLQTAGCVGVETYISRSATNARVAVGYDMLSAGTVNRYATPKNLTGGSNYRR